MRQMFLEHGHRSISVMDISHSVMNQITKVSIVSLFVCVVACTQAGSQAITGYAAASTGPAVRTASAQDVPSNGSSASAKVMQSGQFNTQNGTRKPVYAEAVKGSLTKGAIPGQLPRLCFVSGIGWKLIPISPLSNTEKVSTNGTQGGGGPGGVGADAATVGGGSTVADARASRAKQSNGCPGTLINTMAPGNAIDYWIAGKHTQEMAPERATSMNAGVENWLQAGSVLNPAGNTANQRLMMGLASMPNRGTDLSAKNRLIVSAARINGMKDRAYESSIELRRRMRSAPDLATRIKLQELQDYLAKKSSISKAWSTKDKAVKPPLKRRDHNQPHSSSITSKYRNENGIARIARSDIP